MSITLFLVSLSVAILVLAAPAVVLIISYRKTISNLKSENQSVLQVVLDERREIIELKRILDKSRRRIISAEAEKAEAESKLALIEYGEAISHQDADSGTNIIGMADWIAAK
jgi:hypothetical protein